MPRDVGSQGRDVGSQGCAQQLRLQLPPGPGNFLLHILSLGPFFRILKLERTDSALNYWCDSPFKPERPPRGSPTSPSPDSKGLTLYWELGAGSAGGLNSQGSYRGKEAEICRMGRGNKRPTGRGRGTPGSVPTPAGGRGPF